MAANEGLAARLETEPGAARVVGFDGRQLELRSPRAFAPGAPVRMTVATPDGVDRALEGRSVGSRRHPEGDFHVRLRPVNLRREDREALLGALT